MPAPTQRVALHGARGEGVITLPDGSEVTVLFTNRALVEAEQALGKSILALAQGSGAEGAVSMGDVAQLTLVGMRAARRDARAGGPAPNMADVYDVMDRVGFLALAEIVISAVGVVLTYGKNDTQDGADPNA